MSSLNQVDDTTITVQLKENILSLKNVNLKYIFSLKNVNLKYKKIQILNF